MLKYFYISFGETVEQSSWDIKHIQCNLFKRLKGLKYIAYKRMDLLLVNQLQQEVEMMLSADRTASVKILIDEAFVGDVKLKEGIAALYDYAFKGLLAIWEQNKWDTNDLTNIKNDIVAQSFFADIVYGKTFPSPDKKFKAEFYCRLYPGYAEFFFRVRIRKTIIANIKFLEGHPDPNVFFGFFDNRYWKDEDQFVLSDIAKEVFYVFHVKEGNFIIEYKPAHNSLEQCKNFLQSFGKELSAQQRLRKLLGHA